MDERIALRVAWRREVARRQLDAVTAPRPISDAALRALIGEGPELSAPRLPDLRMSEACARLIRGATVEALDRLIRSGQAEEGEGEEELEGEG